MEIEYATDKASVTVRVNETLTAAQLQSLLSDLGSVRASMSPPVTRNPRDQAQEDVRAPVQDDPHFQIALLESGHFRLWIRSAGFGWMAFEIPATKARAMADYVSARTRPAGNLVREKVDDPHGPH